METTASQDSTPPVMKRLPANAYIRGFLVILVVVGIGFLFTWLGSDRTLPFTPSAMLATPSTVLFFTILWSFVLNWIVGIPAVVLQTEKFFDLTGSLTFITCTLFSLLVGSSPQSSSSSSWSLNPRALIQSIFVLLWAVRLGSFLYGRIQKDSKDGRFDEIKINAPRFFAVWTIQALWVALTALPVFVVNSYAQSATTRDANEVRALDIVGYVVWAVGFAIEVVADRQKGVFAADSSNKGKYIEVGLWYYSRHPNYFGEMTLWLGQFIAALRTFEGSQFALAFCPLFVAFLLVKVSGVPALERRADEKWGGSVEYELYKSNTSVLVPWLKGGKTEADHKQTLLGNKAGNAAV